MLKQEQVRPVTFAIAELWRALTDEQKAFYRERLDTEAAVGRRRPEAMSVPNRGCVLQQPRATLHGKARDVGAIRPCFLEVDI